MNRLLIRLGEWLAASTIESQRTLCADKMSNLRAKHRLEMADEWRRGRDYGYRQGLRAARADQMINAPTGEA